MLAQWYRDVLGQQITLEADGAGLKSTDGGNITRFTRAGDGFVLSEKKGDEPVSRLVLVPNSNGRIEFIFSGGRAFRRVE